MFNSVEVTRSENVAKVVVDFIAIYLSFLANTVILLDHAGHTLIPRSSTLF